MKYLIAGLGNIGEKYANTRHNAGFMLLDFLAGEAGVLFEDRRYGFVTKIKHKGRIFVLLKPSTLMNRSGRAVNYWLNREKIPVGNLLVIVDDIALPFGTIRIRPRGGDGGHNGLLSINQILGTNDYARLRFGIGDEFRRGSQVNYVLGELTDEEIKGFPERAEKVAEAVRSFGTAGLERTMTMFNNK